MTSAGVLAGLIIALGAALIGAAVALRFRQPLIVGYVLAGAVIGPFTPGFIAPVEVIAELAELGVILLMFVIGVQLSLRELIRASRVAVVGGVVQVAALVGIGYAVGRAFGWAPVEAYVFGAVISNSSSTVLTKILSDRGETDSRHAQLALAWSSVQDISTVALVAGLALFDAGVEAAVPTLSGAAIFFAVMVPLAVGVLPRLLRYVTSLHSREVFALAVVTVALAMAGAASLLGVSLALGAFLAGIVVGESDLAHRILGDVIPLRDVFSGVFFVSIGMLLDPAFVAGAWGQVLLAVTLIVLVKGAVAALLALWLGCAIRLAVSVGAALAQSGEFSFLLARIGLETGALRTPTFNLVLSAAIVSIVFAPAVMRAAPAAVRRMAERSASAGPAAAPPLEPGERHAIVCGYGRVGRIVCSLLERHGKPFVVIDENLRLIDSLRARGVPALLGDAGQPYVLDRAGLASARLIILCIPERMAVRRAVEHAREAGTAVTVLARTHTASDRAFLETHGAAEAVLGETELALELARRALLRFEIDPEDVERSISDARVRLE